jgi:hypothetical protein
MNLVFFLVLVKLFLQKIVARVGGEVPRLVFRILFRRPF